MRFTFAHPWILYLLWLVPVWSLLVYFLQQKQIAKRMQFTGKILAGKLLPAENTRLLQAQHIALTGAVFLLLLAAAGPRSTRPEEQEVAMRGRDIVLMLDVSRSMLANDVHPSRLVRAKADMLDILEELRPGDRVAIAVFRYRATRITPFTTDQGFLRQAIAGLSIDSAPAGETNIGAGIQMALEMFDDESPAHKAVILISDGEDLTGDAINAAQIAARRNIPFFTVGIGSRAGSTIPDSNAPRGVFLFEGEPVITRLEDESLVTLARLTGGAYIAVETAGIGSVTLGQRIRDHLRAVEVRAYATIEATDYSERFAYLLLPAILLLLFAGACSKGPIRKRAVSLSVWLLLLGATPAVMADNETDEPARAHRTIAREAQRLQQNEAFDAAAQQFLQAAQAPDLSARLRERYRYNAAIAFLQAGDPETAASLLQGLSPTQQANLARAIAAFEKGKQASDGSIDGYREQLAQWQNAAQLLQQYWQQTGAEAAEEDLQKLDALLPQAAREARLAEILEQYAEAAPPELTWDMLQKQRQQQKTFDPARVPAVGPERLRHFEELANQHGTLADQYLALSHLLQEAGMPPEHLQQFLQQQQEIQQHAQALEDLTLPTDAQSPEVGHPLYNLWSEIGSPESFLQESLRQQEWLQALANGEAISPPPVSDSHLQAEAARLTDRFSERFEMPPDTDPEVQEQVHALAEQAARLQRLAAEMLELENAAEARSVQQEALDALQQLAAILPQPHPSETEDQQEQEHDPEPPDMPDTPPDGDPEDDADMPPPPPPPPDEQDEDEQEPPETPPEDEPEEQEDDTFDLDAMLEQVEQRSQEYRELLQERQRRLQQQRGARDW